MPSMSPISATARLTLVSITIAILAVFAATVGSLETLETAAAFGDKNHAVLMQAKASDAWAFYQAKSMKQNLYAVAAEQAGAKAQEFADKARRYADEQKDIEKEAQGFRSASRRRRSRSSEVHERRHHILTIAVTLLHVAIAVATIAIIMRGQLWPWRPRSCSGSSARPARFTPISVDCVSRCFAVTISSIAGSVNGGETSGDACKRPNTDREFGRKRPILPRG